MTTRGSTQFICVSLYLLHIEDQNPQYVNSNSKAGMFEKFIFFGWSPQLPRKVKLWFY